MEGLDVAAALQAYIEVKPPIAGARVGKDEAQEAVPLPAIKVVFCNVLYDIKHLWGMRPDVG